MARRVGDGSAKNQGGEEPVNVDQLVERLHPQADPLQILCQLTRTSHAIAKLKDGRTVEVQCRPSAPEPEQQAILPFPEETFEVPASLHFTIDGTFRIRAASKQHAERRIEAWLKEVNQRMSLGTLDEDDGVLVTVRNMAVHDAGLRWQIQPPRPVSLLEYRP